jgi:FkbM family methyltransferase
MLHNLRRLLGTAQCSAAARDYHMTVLQRLDQLEARLSGPQVDGPPGATLIELNGDRVWLPDDLLKYVWHTRVSADGDPVPKFLAETEHYLWVRDRLRIGDTALDAGANIGLFTVMMARRVKYGAVGHVHALEPCPRAHGDLTRVLAANRIDNVHPARVALSDTCGRAAFTEFREEDVAREASYLTALDREAFLGAILPGRSTAVIEVETTTLDRYLADNQMRPSLIKLDVEGAEFLALEGGRQFLRDARPLLVIETHVVDVADHFDHDRMRRFLDGLGYRYQVRHKTYYCE